jgi:predicted phage-related endonuclease
MMRTEALSPAAKRLIGTSDYPVALAMAEPGPVGLYNRLRHGIDMQRSPELEEMGELGKLTEMPTAIVAARKLGLDSSKIEKVDTICNPGGRDWCRVSLDPLIKSPAALFECKARADWRLDQEGWGEAGTDDVPLPIWTQVQGQLDAIRSDRDNPRWRGTDLPDIDTIHVAVLVNGQRVLVFPVKRAIDLGAELAERMRKFWIDHVKRGVPPPMDHFEGSAQYLAAMYPKKNKTVRKAEAHELDAIREYVQVREWTDYYFQRKETLKNEVLELIGSDYGIEGPDIKVTAPEYKGRVREGEIVKVLAARLKLSPSEIKEMENFHRGDAYRVLRTKEED